MTRICGIILGICSLSLITGCNAVKTEKDELLFNKIEELQLQIEQEQWDEALSNINHLKKTYDQRKWKLQLLGELEDFKNIELEIEMLKETLKEHDELESKKALSHIKYRLSNIYNM